MNWLPDFQKRITSKGFQSTRKCHIFKTYPDYLLNWSPSLTQQFLAIKTLQDSPEGGTNSYGRGAILAPKTVNGCLGRIVCFKIAAVFANLFTVAYASRRVLLKYEVRSLCFVLKGLSKFEVHIYPNLDRLRIWGKLR